MKKPLLTLLLAAVATTGWAISRQALVNYAASLKGLSGADLKTKLHSLMQPTKVLSYGSGSGSTWSGFYQTDRNAETNECYNRYSTDTYYFSSSTSAISGMNIEHSFPKSWWGGSTNNAYRDLYNLYPCKSTVNTKKSNYPMGVVTNASIYNVDGDCKVGTGTAGGSTIQLWEPIDEYKGDFARSYMYMAITYSNLTFQGTQGLQIMTNEDYPGMKSWATTLYRQWSKQDKVTDLERDRNNAVAKIEGNRNLLVDFPYLAEYVWGDSTSVAFDPSTAITTADDDDRYMNTQEVDPDTPSTGDDNIRFQKINTITSDENQYLIVISEDGTLKAAQPISNGTKTFGYLYTTTVTDNSGIISLATDNISYTLKATTGGYYLIDNQGRYYYMDGSHTSFNYTTSVSSAGIWTVTPQSDGTFRIASTVSSKEYYIQYSSSYSSFGCYNTATGTLPMLYEKVSSTGINAPQAEKQGGEGPRYNLAGQRVDNNYRGIVIQNGRKFLAK